PLCERGSLRVAYRVDHHERDEVDAEEEVREEVPDLAFVLRLLCQAPLLQGRVGQRRVRRRLRGVLARHHSSRCTFVLEACARGRRTRRSTLTWLGRVTAQVIVSATSSAVRGSATPS